MILGVDSSAFRKKSGQPRLTPQDKEAHEEIKVQFLVAFGNLN